MITCTSSWTQRVFFFRTDLPETLVPVVIVSAATFEETGAVGSTQRVLGTGEGCGTTFINILTFRAPWEATRPGTYTGVQSGCTNLSGLCKHGFPLQHPRFPMKLRLLDKINLVAKSFRHAKNCYQTSACYVFYSICCCLTYSHVI